MKFRKKPVVIEAWQLEATDEPMFVKTPPQWLVVALQSGVARLHPMRESDWLHMTIKTLEGDHLASPEDWIIRGVQGELYPCKPDIFAATYEPA